MDKIIELVRSAKLLASNAGYIKYIEILPDAEKLADEFSKLWERKVENEIKEILEWYLKDLKERLDGYSITKK